jgi:small GTP-binding protein
MRSSGPRVVVVGSASVGKTSLINRIVESRFTPITAPTTGTTFFQYNTGHPDHPEIQLWDTAGMERYRSLNNVFYREAVAAILVFDLTSYQSFSELESWLKEFTTCARPNSSVVLCANKLDLADAREVDADEIISWCKDHDDLNCFETSACTGEGVDTMVKALLQILPKEDAAVETVVIPVDEKFTCC